MLWEHPHPQGRRNAVQALGKGIVRPVLLGSRVKSPGAVLGHRACDGTLRQQQEGCLCSVRGQGFASHSLTVVFAGAKCESWEVQMGLRVGALLPLIRYDSGSHGE